MAATPTPITAYIPVAALIIAATYWFMWKHGILKPKQSTGRPDKAGNVAYQNPPERPPGFMTVPEGTFTRSGYEQTGMFKGQDILRFLLSKSGPSGSVYTSKMPQDIRDVTIDYDRFSSDILAGFDVPIKYFPGQSKSFDMKLRDIEDEHRREKAIMRQKLDIASKDFFTQAEFYARMWKVVDYARKGGDSGYAAGFQYNPEEGGPRVEAVKR